jgi:tetratricopeptide (TPR) repeat protein
MNTSPPNQTVALIESGIAALNAGDIATASRAFKKALPKAPKDPALLNLMAVTEIETGRPRSAIRYLKKAIKIAPTFAEAYNTLGVVYRQSQDIAKAIAAFSMAVESDPDSLRALINLTHACNDANQSDLALPHITRLAEMRPQDAGVRYWLGMTRKGLGDLAGAQADFRATVTMAPGHGGAWWQLAGLKGLEIDADRPALESALATHADLPDEAAKIAFSLFLGSEQVGDTDEAARYLIEGNALQHRAMAYVVADDERQMADIAQCFPSVETTKPAPAKSTAITPVFVLGMPRSGTTLIEQILASHSSVYGAGECDSVARVVRQMTGDTVDYPQSALKWRDRDYARIGADILEHLSEMAEGAEFVIDKTPRNFLYLAAIRRALPQARIIHCQRDPIDTAFSNYRQLFTNGNGFAYDQQDLVRYMTAYETLMSHWRGIMPDGFYEVRYEDVIADQKGETQRLLTYCGLDWQDACLDFHKTERSVQTASAAQVRNELYATSVRSWQPYAEHISTLIDGLAVN